MRRKHPLIEQAVARLGSQDRLAAAAGTTQSTIGRLLNCEQAISAEIAVAIERATGGEVTAKALRPDLPFIEPAHAAAAP